ncbi:MAG: ROK family protein [Kiritimatiellae bacterium]|nr:ROK family protein [Kiritimatiellia bacterium]
MTTDSEIELVVPGIQPPLDPGFRPAVLANRAFQKKVEAAGGGERLVIGIEAESGTISTFETRVLPADHPAARANLFYAERLVKFLLWQRGGWRILLGGPAPIGAHIKAAYAAGGPRAFDADLMGGVYEKTFTVDVMAPEAVPPPSENPRPLGRHLDGCRIGFDLGASDHKVSAVQDGEPAFSAEIVWDPKNQTDPQYHYDRIMAALRKAASHLPRVDAIGGSAAGIYINNRVRVASLFRGIPKDLFDSRVRDMFLDLRKEWQGIPFEVINDGEVTALAGSMSLETNKVLGVAMGSSEAAGYVDENGNIKGWLDELAFAPVDYNPAAPVDEWSGDKGCGVGYFCQVGVNRLAGMAGIALDPDKGLPDRLKDVQALMEQGDEKAKAVFESLGVYFGYAMAHYADFYDYASLLVLGRVTSGAGGDLIVRTAADVLAREFPELAGKIAIRVPDEKSRRVGQAIAAASLPAIRK